VFPSALSEAERRQVDEARTMPNVTCFFEYLPHEELNTLTAMCTVQFAAYSRFLHSSNKIVRACVYRTPLVVAATGCMGDVVSKHRLGQTCDPSNVGSIDAAIAHCLTMKPTTADWEGYLASNSLASLRRALAPLVAEGSGMAAALEVGTITAKDNAT